MLTTIRVPDVCERDIDLLLLEEFVSSPAFLSWFLSQIGAGQAAVLTEGCRSVKTVNGESDLELSLEDGSGLIRILVENKIDASLQPNQPQRYAIRAEQYRSLGKYREVMTVVMAPEVYFGNDVGNLEFDATVTYEAALAWFEQADLGARKQYKLVLLRGAIERGRLGWKLIPHRAVSEFWQAYWQLCEQLAPQLSMPVPKSEIPADSNFIRFRPALLPANVSLWHKVGFGHVDLQFAGMGDKLAEVEKLYRSSIQPSMRIERAAKSAVIRIRVDPVEMTSSAFSSCKGSIRKGIEAAAQLLDWYSKIQRPKERMTQPNAGVQVTPRGGGA